MSWIVRLTLRDVKWALPRVASAYLALVLGIAALVAILGSEADLRASLADNTKELLGSDIEFSSKRPFSSEFLVAARSQAVKSATEIRFRTMASNPANGKSRLVQLQAGEASFPFYGEIITSPASAWQAVHSAQEPGVVVEEALLGELGLTIGSSLRIGPHQVKVLGVMRQAPGLMVPAYVVSPRVFVARSLLDGSTLLRHGALADHLLFLKLPPSADPNATVQTLRPVMAKEHLDARTHEQRAEVLGRLYSNVGQFLSLAAFVALLIGASAAVASTHIYLQQKITLVALLRSLGATRRQTSLLCLLEVCGLALCASLLGIALGFLMQLALANLLFTFVHSEIVPALHSKVVFTALILGVGSVALYTMPLLSTLSKVTPLQALRPISAANPVANSQRLLTSTMIMLVTVVFGFAVSNTVQAALTISATALIGLCACAATAFLLLRLVRTLPEHWLPFTVRHGVKNLERPGNATLPLVMALGMVGICTNIILICGHFLALHTQTFEREETPSVFLYDIQADQENSLRTVLREVNARVLQENPVVMMRIDRVRGTPVADLLATQSDIPSWALTREYWSSYREHPANNETITSGQWIPHVQSLDDPVPVSVEDRVAERLGVSLGDEIVFEVQSQPLHARVTSLRNVQWERMERNALMVFPKGVLEDAPQSRFYSARIESAGDMDALQAALQSNFQNVSMVDLRMVLRAILALVDTLEWILTAVTAMIAFAALLSIVGLGIAGREIRFKELTLLRALGASRSQLHSLLRAEYAILATLGVLLGIVVSLPASRYLASEIFRSPFSLPWSQLFLANMALLFIVIVTITWVHRSLRNRSVSQLLQDE